MGVDDPDCAVKLRIVESVIAPQAAHRQADHPLASGSSAAWSAAGRARAWCPAMPGHRSLGQVSWVGWAMSCCHLVRWRIGTAVDSPILQIIPVQSTLVRVRTRQPARETLGVRSKLFELFPAASVRNPVGQVLWLWPDRPKILVGQPASSCPAIVIAWKQRSAPIGREE